MEKNEKNLTRDRNTKKVGLERTSWITKLGPLLTSFTSHWAHLLCCQNGQHGVSLHVFKVQLSCMIKPRAPGDFLIKITWVIRGLAPFVAALISSHIVITHTHVFSIQHFI